MGTARPGRSDPGAGAGHQAHRPAAPARVAARGWGFCLVTGRALADATGVALSGSKLACHLGDRDVALHVDWYIIIYGSRAIHLLTLFFVIQNRVASWLGM